MTSARLRLDARPVSFRVISFLGNEAVTLTRNRLDEARFFGIIPERKANLADGGVDSMLGVNKNILAPEALDDFISRDEIPIFAREQDEQLHGDLFQLDRTTGTEKFKTVAVEGELVELDWACRHGEWRLRWSRSIAPGVQKFRVNSLAAISCSFTSSSPSIYPPCMESAAALGRIFRRRPTGLREISSCTAVPNQKFCF